MEKKQAHDTAMFPLCVCARVRACPFQLLNQLTNFQGICYKLYAIGGHPNLILL